MNSNSKASTNISASDGAEGIWSMDIEESFVEALALYPACGRRKIILQEEGKMYGRNELVARYIKLRTGKTRTRKQVSSHLQVLTKRHSKELEALRNDKQKQQVILERLRRDEAKEAVSMNTDDRNNIPVLETSAAPIQNLILPLLITESLNPIGRSRTTTEQLRSPEDSFSASLTKVITDRMSLHTSVTGKITKKKKTISNSVLSNMVHNTVSHFLPISRPSNSPDVTSFRCSSNASPLSPFSCGSTNHQIIFPPAIIGDENFRLNDLSAFIELKRTMSSTHASLIYPYSESCSIYQHDFLRLHTNDIQIKNLSAFETISIDQIYDKFPHHDSLKDLFERNPHGPFFLIKFWADVSASTSVANSMTNRDESFFTSYTYTSCSNRPIHISTRLCSFGKQVLEKVEISDYPQRDIFDQFIYRFDRSPLCDYMAQFIQKLRSLPSTSMMNNVLENFTILQVIKCRDDSARLLLCLAFVFEIATFDGDGPQYQVYKLIAS